MSGGGVAQEPGMHVECPCQQHRVVVEEDTLSHSLISVSDGINIM